MKNEQTKRMLDEYGNERKYGVEAYKPKKKGNINRIEELYIEDNGIKKDRKKQVIFWIGVMVIIITVWITAYILI